MRKFSLIAAIVLCLAGCITTNPRHELAVNDRNVEQVIEAPGLTQSQIYSAAVLWITETFKRTKFEYENQHEGTFIQKGARVNVCLKTVQTISGGTTCSLSGRADVSFTMRFETKDGKYKITYTNINLWHYDAYGKRDSSAAPLRYQEDMDVVKQVLFRQNTEIQASINRGSNKW